MAVADFPIYEAIEAAARKEWLRAMGFGAGTTIEIANSTVPANAPSGTIVGQLRSDAGLEFSVVSGPFSISPAGELVTSAIAPASGSTLTARVNALRASPYLSVIQDIVVSVDAVEVTPPSNAWLLSTGFWDDASIWDDNAQWKDS